MSRHMIRGRQLSRDTEHRKALRRNMIQSLFEHGQIRTTGPKAKECKAMADKMISLAKVGTLTARRAAIAQLTDRRLVDEKQEFTGQSVIQKLFTDIAPKFADRRGGYTRIIRTADHRIGDAGDIFILQLVTEGIAPTGTVRKAAGLRRKRNDKRKAFAAKVMKKEQPKAEEAKA